MSLRSLCVPAEGCFLWVPVQHFEQMKRWPPSPGLHSGHTHSCSRAVTGRLSVPCQVVLLGMLPPPVFWSLQEETFSDLGSAQGHFCCVDPLCSGSYHLSFLFPPWKFSATQ